ncbi:Transcription factor DIVARICATA, partial [Mucuna pruriens]
MEEERRMNHLPQPQYENAFSTDVDHTTSTPSNPLHSSTHSRSFSLPDLFKKNTHWTQEEHIMFLYGMEKYGRGSWKKISQYFVITKTPNQIASHAQKYFNNKNVSAKKNKRRSIHDITLEDVERMVPASVDQQDLVIAPNFAMQQRDDMMQFNNPVEVTARVPDHVDQQNLVLPPNFAMQQRQDMTQFNNSNEVKAMVPDLVDQQNLVLAPNFALQQRQDMTQFNNLEEVKAMVPNHFDQQNLLLAPNFAMQQIQDTTQFNNLEEVKAIVPYHVDQQNLIPTPKFAMQETQTQDMMQFNNPPCNIMHHEQVEMSQILASRPDLVLEALAMSPFNFSNNMAYQMHGGYVNNSL